MRRVFVGMSTSLALIAAAQASNESPVTYDVMVQIVAPQADRLWEVAGFGTNDAGEPDGANLTAEHWATLSDAAQQMKSAASAMASAQHHVVAKDGVKISGEDTPGAPSAKQVQAHIEKNPQGFTQQSAQLADISEAFLQAAATRDVIKLQAATEQMGAACETCHAQFWYPQ